MGQIQIETCEIEGLRVITPQVFGDARGYFMETYQKEQFVAAGINMGRAARFAFSKTSSAG